MKKTTLAVIVGTRDFFPADPVRQGRQEVLSLLAALGIDTVVLDETDTPMAAVETWEQSKKCAALFRANRDRIDGILVVLPVFGPEKAIADTIKLSELNVPIMVQAHPDELDSLNVELRGDAFCGKISVCNNLYQYGIPFSLTEEHAVYPNTASFKADLQKFAGVCRVVSGLRKARIGAVGARPNLFNTVRYSEKLLQAHGVSVSTVDLSELFGAAGKLSDQDRRVVAQVETIRNYINTISIPAEALLKMARLGVVLDDWVAANEVDAIAFQCWTSIQQYYGVNACTLLSMLSERLTPAACEVDVTGALSMVALQLASGKPSALVDWNNNYGSDPNKCILFHCGNWATSFFSEVTMANAEILATTLGTHNTYGTLSGQAAATPMTYARITTDDRHGKIRTYVGQGRLTGDPLDTFGSRAVAEIPNLRQLLHYICKNGFEHHCAMNPAQSAEVLAEAFETYLGWEVHRPLGWI